MMRGISLKKSSTPSRALSRSTTRPRVAAINASTAAMKNSSASTNRIMRRCPVSHAQPAGQPMREEARHDRQRQRDETAPDHEVRAEERQFPDQCAAIAEQRPARDEGDGGADAGADREERGGDREHGDRPARHDDAGERRDDQSEQIPIRRRPISPRRRAASAPRRTTAIRQAASTFGKMSRNSMTSAERISRNRACPSRQYTIAAATTTATAMKAVDQSNVLRGRRWIGASGKETCSSR